MASHKNIISGLDINKSTICYARCIPEERLIANICIQPIESGAENYWDAVTNGFTELLKELDISGESIIASLSGEQAIIKKIILDIDEPDVENAIQWELSQQITGSIDEFVYDYQLIDNGTDESSQRYLVVGYRESMVGRLSTLLKAKKLNPVVVDIDIFALINIFEINYQDKITKPAAIIFSDLHSTKVILTHQGMFIDLEIFTHTDDTIEAEKYVESISDTLRILSGCNPDFSKIETENKYLTGSLFSDPEFTKKVLHSMPNSEILYPFRKITCSAGMDDEKLQEFAPQLAVSVGLTLRDIE